MGRRNDMRVGKGFPSKSVLECFFFIFLFDLFPGTSFFFFYNIIATTRPTRCILLFDWMGPSIFNFLLSRPMILGGFVKGGLPQRDCSAHNPKTLICHHPFCWLSNSFTLDFSNFYPQVVIAVEHWHVVIGRLCLKSSTLAPPKSMTDSRDRMSPLFRFGPGLKPVFEQGSVKRRDIRSP